MTTNPSPAVGFGHAALAPIDIADAMDLLATAANDPSRNCGLQPAASPDDRCRSSRYASDGRPHGLIGQALSTAEVAVADLESMGDRSLRDLYRDNRLPIAITLGALIVLDAAQRSQERGHQLDDVLDDATAAAARFLDLVAVLPALARHAEPAVARPNFKPRVHGASFSSRESPCAFMHAS
jgi:hypothetical protein